MTDAAIAKPDPALFSRNDKPGEYTARVEVRGTISIPIKAESQEDAQRQAEAELERIYDEEYVEIDDIRDARLEYTSKDRPMYRVTREGKSMQVTRLEAGDLPREPDEKYGF